MGGSTSCHLVPARPQRLKEAEAINGDQGRRVKDAELLMLGDTSKTRHCGGGEGDGEGDAGTRACWVPAL